MSVNLIETIENLGIPEVPEERERFKKEKTVLLIAAAPEMYEALECIETAIGYAKEMSANYILEKQDVDLILSALAKARGENTNQPSGANSEQ